MFIKERTKVLIKSSTRIHLTYHFCATWCAFAWSSFPAQATPSVAANAGNVEVDRGEQGIHIHQGRMISVARWILIHWKMHPSSYQRSSCAPM